METYRHPATDIPVCGHYDVIVVGGGCAGFAAAVAASRLGAKTLVLEQYPYFGGTATASLMCDIVGIRNQAEPCGLQVMKGIGEELILKLLAEGGASAADNPYVSVPRSDTKGDLSYSYAFDPEIFKKVTLETALDAGCKILFHVWFSDTITENGTVKGVVFEGKSGRCAAFARTVVDATGDGDAAFRAGASFRHIRGNEAPRLNDAMMYRIGGCDAGTDVRGCRAGDTMVLWGPSSDGRNGADTRELSDMEIRLRRQIFPHLEGLKKDHPSLKNARVLETPALLGIRQTRFIDGDYVLTGRDVLSGARFEDAVAMGVNPVVSYYGYRRFLEHEGYEIPYRCLLPAGLEGILVAGRCISGDQAAFESYRAMSHILSIGEAAGTAAALSAWAGVTPRALDRRLLRETLILRGAEIGQGRTLP